MGRGWWRKGWKSLVAVCLLLYALIVISPLSQRFSVKVNPQDIVRADEPRAEKEESIELPGHKPDRIDISDKWNKALQAANHKIRPQRVDAPKEDKKAVAPPPQPDKHDLFPKKDKAKSGRGIGTGNSFKFEFVPVSGEPFVIEDVLTNKGISLEERMTAKVDANAKPKIIATWNTGLSSANMEGCPEWNCHVRNSRENLHEADAIIIMHDEGGFARTPDQYVVYFSQESPAHSGFNPAHPDFFNMSFGFRHDTPAASPYGYTVRLAADSHAKPPFISAELVRKKRKGAAWFVSHCSTASQRERLVEKMRQTIDVDIYGSCGQLQCPRGGDCENMLDDTYFFYVTFENSVCKDYITEKVWNQGYKRDIVPVVLKRALAEPYLPPNSFIAADDFTSVEKLTAHMHYLMTNTTAYMEYFEWRREYKVVFLNGKEHDVLERPWGMCQLCRILWQEPRPKHSIPNFREWWDATCEAQGSLVASLLKGSEEEAAKNLTRS